MVNSFGFGGPFWGFFGLLVEGLAILVLWHVRFYQAIAYLFAFITIAEWMLTVSPLMMLYSLYLLYFSLDCGAISLGIAVEGTFVSKVLVNTIVFARVTRCSMSLGMLLVLFCFLIFSVEVICFSFVLLGFDGF